MANDPAMKARQIVRVESHKCFARVVVGMTEAAAVLAFEQHDTVAPQTPARQRLAESFRHGAEIFPDNDTMITHALLGYGAQRRLEGKSHIGTLARWTS